MACLHSRRPSEALLRIFVHPVGHVHASKPLARASLDQASRTCFQNHRAQRPLEAPILQRRYYRRPPQSNKAAPATDEPPRDEAIAAPYINLVAEDGTFYPGQRLHRILHTFDRRTHTLQLVSPGNANLPREDRNHYPTCKIFTLEELAGIRKRKAQSVAENAKKIRKIDVGSKELELSWAIGENDLMHRMKRAREFLAEGRRLDVTLKRKKGTRDVTERECRRLVDAIEGELGQVQGAKERKDPEGDPGKIMTLFWQGTELPKTQETPDSL